MNKTNLVLELADKVGHSEVFTTRNTYIDGDGHDFCVPEWNIHVFESGSVKFDECDIFSISLITVKE